MVGSGLENEIGSWVPGNEADLSLEGLDFFNFPSVCLEGDGLDEGDWNAKLQDIELYTSDSFLDTSHGDILNAASKPKQEPPSEFAEEAPRTRISAHNGYSDGLDSRNNQAPSPDSVLNSNHSSSGEKGISTSSEDLIRPQPYSSQSHDSSAPRRSKRVASKPVYRSFNYPDFYIPDTVACLGEEQPQKKKKRKLSKVSDTGKVSLCSSQHIKCSCCDATETIQLREGPLGPKMLCNSCGIQYRYGRLFQEYHPSPRTTFDPSPQTRFYMKGGGQEENKAVPESYLVLDEEVPELETESKMSMSSDDFEFHPKGNSSKQKLKKKVKLTMQTSSSSDNQRCSHCDVGKTTQWRLGPMGPRTLCNACGIRYRSGRLFPEYRPADSPTFVPSLHSFSHRKVIELRKKAMQEASRVFKEPILSQPKVRRVQSSVGTHFISPSKDMKEEAIIATKPPLAQGKEIREAYIQEATSFDVELPLQPLGAIEEAIFTDSEPQVSYSKDVKEAATFEAVVADSEHLFSLHNDTKKEADAAIAAPMSLPCKNVKETSFIGIKPPLVTSKDTEKALNTDIELPNATKGAAVAIREPPLHLKAIQEAVEPRTRTSPSKAMKEMVIANGETMLKRKNPVTRIRKKKLPKVSGIAGTSKKPLQKPTETRKCLHCGINKSPLWREGPLGKQTLCNACGIRHASGRLHPEYRPAASPTFVPTLHSSSHKKVVQLRQEEGHYSMIFNSSNV